MLEREITLQLVGALVLAAAEGVARVHQRLPLAGDAVAQLGHVVLEQAILLADEEEVLVARQQIPEGLRREQHLVGVQRPALVDVHQAALEHGALLLERVLREQQVHRRAIDLIGEAVDLAVELVHDAVGTLFLPLDVRELVGERMHLGAEPLQLLLDLCPLAADVFQSPLVISQLLVEGGGALRGKRRCTKDVAQRRHEASRHGSTPHTFRKCRPTEAAEPKKPINIPNPTIATAWSREKKAA